MDRSVVVGSERLRNRVHDDAKAAAEPSPTAEAPEQGSSQQDGQGGLRRLLRFLDSGYSRERETSKLGPD